MIRFELARKVYLHREAVDFRKSINGLAALVEQGLALDPFAAALYVFRNQRRDRIKILGWERNGYWLCMKRLEADRFIWPRQPVQQMRQPTQQQPVQQQPMAQLQRAQPQRAQPQETEVIEMTVEQLHWLLAGVDVEALRGHRERRYHRAS